MAKKRPIKDPYAHREAEKYENPIPSREFILQYMDEHEQLVDAQQLLQALQLDTEEQAEALRRRLRAMERDGQLIRTRRGQYGLLDKMDLCRGHVICHPDGFGFLVPDDKQADVFIPEHQMRRVFHGDRIIARKVQSHGREEAVIVDVLQHNTQQVVGYLTKRGQTTYVSAENKRITHNIIIPEQGMNDAEQGQMVLVKITSQPSLRKFPEGEVIEILGEHMAPGMEIDVAIHSHGIPHKMSEAVIEEVSHISDRVSAADKQDRLDLRELPLVTIDGEDAKDFDDAVYCEQTDGGWRLYVAIADVAHYVKPNTALDQDAAERGNSVYFPGRVIPMLPFQLSSGLCSLKPRVDRLCVVCVMNITAQGAVRHYKFHNAVMRSHARLTYDKVAKILNNKDKHLHLHYKPLIPHLKQLHKLYKVLFSRRKQRGALDFEFPETQFIFDKNRKINKIIAKKRNDAHRLIEECMLAANVCAAKFLIKHKLPGLYRIHAAPQPSRLADLRDFLHELGLKLNGGEEPKPKHYMQLLNQVSKRSDANLIQMVLLRSLSQAIYHPENEGHFGLAYEEYGHYTSPIRRYPDLLMHRAIKHIIETNKPKTFIYSQSDMEAYGEHCSFTERRADDATRDVSDWLKCEYMIDKIGDTFAGTIVSITSFGLFVSLDDVFVEGLVHISDLYNDYYHYDQLRHRLVGRRGNVYRVGDKLTIVVAKVSLDNRQIDFILADKQDDKKTAKKKKSKGKSRAKKGSQRKPKATDSKSGSKPKPTAKKGSQRKSKATDSKSGSKPKPTVKNKTKKKTATKSRRKS